jgi:hypothetical protein
MIWTLSNFRARTFSDAGQPTYGQLPNGYTITLPPNARGRWLLTPYTMPEPATILTLTGTIDATLAATANLIFYTDYKCTQYHSSVTAAAINTTDTPFSFQFTTPNTCSGLRLDLRAWHGTGSATWTDLQMITDDHTPTPEPSTSGHTSGNPLLHYYTTLTGIMWDNNIFLTRTPNKPPTDE